MTKQKASARLIDVGDVKKLCDFALYFLKALGMDKLPAYSQPFQALRKSKDLEAENCERLIS